MLYSRWLMVVVCWFRCCSCAPVRGPAHIPGCQSHVGGGGQVSGDQVLHGADRHQDADEVRQRAGAEVRTPGWVWAGPGGVLGLTLSPLPQVSPGVSEGSGNGGGAHQPGGLAVVLHSGGGQALSRGGHLLADGDGTWLAQAESAPPLRRRLRRPLLVRTHACFGALQGGHVLTPLPAATPLKPGSAVSNRSAERGLGVPPRRADLL